jgi:hypothetical protein
MGATMLAPVAQGASSTDWVVESAIEARMPVFDRLDKNLLLGQV